MAKAWATLPATANAICHSLRGCVCIAMTFYIPVRSFTLLSHQTTRLYTLYTSAHPFWAQACTSVKWRLRVVESVINSLLLCGLESVQLTLAEQNCLDAFQMMMLRKLLSCTQCNCIQGGTNQKRHEKT